MTFGESGGHNEMSMRDVRIPVEEGVLLHVVAWQRDGAGQPGAAPKTAEDGTAVGGTTSSHLPYVLVHGLASNARLWDGVARRLSDAGSQVAAVDLRGHGLSGKPDAGYDFATIDEDLRAVIRSLGFERPVLVGQSWGANVVLDFAVRHADLIRGFVAVDGGLSDMQDPFPTWEECWGRLAPPRLVGLPLTQIEGYIRGAHTDWPEEGIRGTLANFELRGDGTIAPWLTRERHAAVLRSLWAHRPSELWPALRVPAIIVPADTGDGEWTTRKRRAVDVAEAAARSSGVPVRVAWFRADHDIHAQHPDELVALLLEAERDGFFAGLPRASSTREAEPSTTHPAEADPSTAGPAAAATSGGAVA